MDYDWYITIRVYQMNPDNPETFPTVHISNFKIKNWHALGGWQVFLNFKNIIMEKTKGKDEKSSKTHQGGGNSASKNSGGNSGGSSSGGNSSNSGKGHSGGDSSGGNSGGSGGKR